MKPVCPRSALLPLAVVAVLAALGGLVACGPPTARDATTTGGAAAPVSPRATLEIEPPQLGIGDVAEIRLRVAAPPGSRLLLDDPSEVPGLWILEAKPLTTLQEAGRWVHQHLYRVRPRAVGEYRWPPFEVTIEAADGERTRLAVPERNFAVVSTIDSASGPPRLSPFGLRPPPRAGDDHFWTGVVVGAGSATLLAGALGLFVGLRRSRESPGDPAVPAEVEAADALSRWADDRFRRAEGAMHAGDERRALNILSGLLRSYTEKRFDTELLGRTTEELSATQPPLRLTSRWPELLRLFRSLDDARFRPDAASSDRTAQCLRELREFVANAQSPKARNRPRDAEPGQETG